MGYSRSKLLSFSALTRYQVDEASSSDAFVRDDHDSWTERSEQRVLNSTDSDRGCYSVIMGVQPRACGAVNGFLGEIQDAAEVALMAVFLPMLGTRPGFSVQARSRMATRYARVPSASLVTFGLMSVFQVDYRRYGISRNLFNVETFRKANTRSKESAGRCCRYGFVVGAIAGLVVMKRMMLPFRPTFILQVGLQSMVLANSSTTVLHGKQGWPKEKPEALMV